MNFWLIFKLWLLTESSYLTCIYIIILFLFSASDVTVLPCRVWIVMAPETPNPGCGWWPTPLFLVSKFKLSLDNYWINFSWYWLMFLLIIGYRWLFLWSGNGYRWYTSLDLPCIKYLILTIFYRLCWILEWGSCNISINWQIWLLRPFMLNLHGISKLWGESQKLSTLLLCHMLKDEHGRSPNITWNTLE